MINKLLFHWNHDIQGILDAVALIVEYGEK